MRHTFFVIFTENSELPSLLSVNFHVK